MRKAVLTVLATSLIVGSAVQIARSCGTLHPQIGARPRAYE